MLREREAVKPPYDMMISTNNQVYYAKPAHGAGRQKQQVRARRVLNIYIVITIACDV